MARIGDFISVIAAVSPDTHGAQVFDRFQSEPNTLVIAVVDADNRPVGLIERNAFTLRMAAEFGRALYARRPASSLMNESPRILDADTDAAVLFQSLDAGDLGGLLNGFIVTSGGRYVGVGAGVHVLQAGSAIHRRRAEEMSALVRDLGRAEQEARASSRAKSEFLAVMSHEIRTPLNGVLGVAALMERELTQTKMRPYVRTILDSGQSLLRLLTDALDMSRADAGLMSFETAPVHLDRLGEDLLALWSPRADEKGLTLSVDLRHRDHDWVVGDEMRLKQLFNNLIGNALKFTLAGGSRSGSSARGRDGRRRRRHRHGGRQRPGRVRRRRREHLRSVQHRSRGPRRRRRGSRPRHLPPDRRATGRVHRRGPVAPGRRPLPLHRGPVRAAGPEMREARRQIAEPTPHETVHVLIVDDNATNRFVAGKMLELFGCTSETAENGQEAVERVSAEPFDLVLMDIKMPVMDGVEATRAIRAWPARRRASRSWP
jgi:signal transduction histidine kinase